MLENFARQSLILASICRCRNRMATFSKFDSTTGGVRMLLFGSRRLKSINTVRFQTFKRKYESENRISDLSLLPPCKSSLYLHILRSCYVARIWRLSLTSCPPLPAVENHGWTEEHQVKWIETAFPDDVSSILLTDGFEEEEYEEGSDESDESDESDNEDN